MNNQSNMLVWDLIKVKTREFTQSCCMTRSHRKKNRILILEDKLKDIDILLQKNDLADLKEKKNIIEAEIMNELKDQATASQVRSRAKWIEKGEKNNSYFFGLEKSRQQNNIITKVRKPDGRYTINMEETMYEIRIFYEQLYTSTNTGDDNFFENLTINNTLTETDRQKCEGYITKQEYLSAVAKIKNNKSPGPDGIPNEFHKMFSKELSAFLITVFNECFDKGTITFSQKISVVALIHKKGSKYDLKNYRPISLTCTDYKILAQILADRMHTILDKVISFDQSGYVKGRFLGHNIRTVEEVIYLSKKHQLDGIIAFLDFAKAFDSIEWGFIYESLNKLNFGQNFIKWIKTLYADPKMLIKNNGWLTEHISVTRSVKQGCPVSALLFIVAIKMLSIRLKQNNLIQGLKVRSLLDCDSNKEFKTLQYADDIMLLTKDEESLKFALQDIHSFSKQAGTRLNLEKSEIIGLGRYKLRNQITGIHVKENVNCLGISVGHNKSVCIQINWDDKILKLKQTLSNWKRRNLTMIGKISIIKTLGVSKLIFSAQNTSISEEKVYEINIILYKFLWPNKERLKRKTLILPLEEGGLYG